MYIYSSDLGVDTSSCLDSNIPHVSPNTSQFFVVNCIKTDLFVAFPSGLQ